MTNTELSGEAVPPPMRAEIEARLKQGLDVTAALLDMHLATTIYDDGARYMKGKFPEAFQDLAVAGPFSWGFANGHAVALFLAGLVVGMPEFRGNEGAALDMLRVGWSLDAIQAALRARCRVAAAAAEGAGSVVSFNRRTGADV